MRGQYLNNKCSFLKQKPIFLGELSFGGRWAPKLTKGPYNSSNWVEGYEIVMDKYTL